MGLGLYAAGQDGVGELFTAFALEGNVTTVTLAPPSSDALTSLDEAQPSFRGVFYVTGVFGDVNEDGAKDDEEVFLGAGPPVVAWLEGVPSEYASIGLQDGWNPLIMSEDPPKRLPDDEVELALNLSVGPPIELRGKVEEGFPRDNRRVALIPERLLDGWEVGSLLYDEALSETFEMTLADPPPLDHSDPTGGVPGLAMEIPMTYYDRDRNGNLSRGDSEFTPMCLDSEPVVALWVPQPFDIGIAWSFVQYEVQPGWRATLVSSLETGWESLTEDESRRLMVSEDCAFE